MILEDTSVIPPNSWSRSFRFLPLGCVLPNVSCLAVDISSALVVTLLSLMLLPLHFGTRDNEFSMVLAYKLEDGSVHCSLITSRT